MAWPAPSFPVGCKFFRAYMPTKNIAGKNIEGRLYVSPETPMVWTATGQLIVAQTVDVGHQNGEVQMYLPYSDQSGFTSGLTGEPITGFAYLMIDKPTKAGAVTTTKYVTVNGADYGNVDGATVLIGNLMDIGAWPHAPIKVYPPSSGGGGGDTTVLVETPSGSGIFRKV